MNAIATKPATNARNARRAEIIAAFDAAGEALQAATFKVEAAEMSAERAEKVAALVHNGEKVNEFTMDMLHDAARSIVGWRAYDLTAAAALPYYLEAIAAKSKAAAAALAQAQANFKAAEKAYNRLRF